MWARKALRTALLQLALATAGIGVSLVTHRLEVGALIDAISAPLAVVVLHRLLRSLDESEDATWLRLWAFIASALAVAFAVGFVTALDPTVRLPFSRVQSTTRPPG